MGWDKVSTVPAVNVTEANGNFKITMAAPGLRKEDFKIDVDGNLITISAEKSTEKEEKEEKCLNFFQCLLLPSSATRPCR